MSFEDILTLLIGSVEANTKPGQLVQACKKLNMKPHEYFNIYGEPLYSIRYDFIFDTTNGEKPDWKLLKSMEGICCRQDSKSSIGTIKCSILSSPTYTPF